jgi:hypothetical protein
MDKFRSNSKDRAKLDEWFRSPTLDHLEELSFNDGYALAATIRAPPRAYTTARQVHELPFAPD